MDNSAAARRVRETMVLEPIIHIISDYHDAVNSSFGHRVQFNFKQQQHVQQHQSVTINNFFNSTGPDGMNESNMSQSVQFHDGPGHDGSHMNMMG